MERYIDLEELEKRIKKYVKPEIPEEKAFVDYYKDECIRQAYCMPTADVVPKSEVEELKGELAIAERHEKDARALFKDAVIQLQNARREVAREIFEEIEKEIDLGLSVITKNLNAKGGRANGKTVLISKYDVFIEAKKYIAELKKKYMEAEE